jgi:hypothetical protein
LLPSFPVRVVRRAIRRGSSLPVVAETPGGTFVVKLRGAGQGVHPLIAEVIVAELAETLGLPVPERARLELEPGTASEARHEEVLALLDASAGTNLGFRYLPEAKELGPHEAARLDESFIARVLWLDGLVMNPDRTRDNPNVLLWNGQPWLIDHGAALTFHHDFEGVTEESPREATDWTPHLFATRTKLLTNGDAAFARRISREALARAAAAVPDEFLHAAFPGENSARVREQYVAFLWKRLKPPRPFVPQPFHR